MNNKPGIEDEIPFEEINAFAHAGLKSARPKYETLSPEAFLERVRNADRILENCRNSMRGV